MSVGQPISSELDWTAFEQHWLNALVYLFHNVSFPLLNSAELPLILSLIRIGLFPETTGWLFFSLRNVSTPPAGVALTLLFSRSVVSSSLQPNGL